MSPCQRPQPPPKSVGRMPEVSSYGRIHGGNRNHIVPKRWLHQACWILVPCIAHFPLSPHGIWLHGGRRHHPATTFPNPGTHHNLSGPSTKSPRHLARFITMGNTNPLSPQSLNSLGVMSPPCVASPASSGHQDNIDAWPCEGPLWCSTNQYSGRPQRASGLFMVGSTNDL